MIPTTILLLASIVQSEQPELLPAPREMELLSAPREQLHRIPEQRYFTPELRPERLSISLRELERLGHYRSAPMYDPSKSMNEERAKSDKMMRDLKKFEEFNDGLAKQSRERSERKLEVFGIVIGLAIVLGVLRAIFK